MDRRKAKIITHYEEIDEEKNAILENIQKIISQVYLCVESVKISNDNVKQKDLQAILNYELAVLKRLTEVNLSIESFMEEEQVPVSPLEATKFYESINKSLSFNVPSKFFSIPERTNSVPSSLNETTKIDTISKQISELLLSTKKATNENDVQKHNIPETQEQNVQTDSAAAPECLDKVLNVDRLKIDCGSNSHIASIILNKTDMPSTSTFVDGQHDISQLKDSLQKFQEKFLSEKSLTCMTDFYQKSSTSSNLVETPFLKNCEFEKPEKDVEPSCSNTKDKEIPECSSKAIVKEEINTCEEQLIPAEECESGVDSDEMTPSNYDASEETSIILNNGEFSDCTTDETKNPRKRNSALEKLNNMEIYDRRTEALTKIKPVTIPDLSLKPNSKAAGDSYIIKNEFEVKSKKKGNKKNKKNSNNEFYELRDKDNAVIGTECAFSHIESPLEFYLHLIDEDCKMIDVLNDQIREYYEGTISEYTTKSEANTKIGRYSFVYLTNDDGWYRAEIIDWCLDKKTDEVKVQLVDYGSKYLVSYKNLRKLNKYLSEYPKLAVRCHLPLLYPPNSTITNHLTDWPPGSIDALVDLSGLHHNTDKTNIFRIVYAQKNGNSTAVDLYNINDSSEDHTVGQILLDLGLAVQIIDEVDENNMELEEFLQDINKMENTDNINEAITGYDARDEARICRFTRKNGTCFKGKNCKLEHVPFTKGGFTSDTVPVFNQAFNDLQIPAKEEVVSILVTGYIDSCSFYAQIIRNVHEDANFTMDKDLFSLMEIMNSPRMVRTYEPFKISPALGEIVIAKHWSHKWLRGTVRHLVLDKHGETEKVQVFILDFGETVDIPMSDLRQMKEDFLHLPFQAVECYLYNYQQRKDVDAKKAKEFFEKEVCFRNFLAKVMSTMLPLKLYVTSIKGFDIGVYLERLQLAEKRTVDINPEDGNILDMY